MNKIFTSSVLITTSLFAATPVHDLLDERVKGKSFGGTVDDTVAASDGVGIIPFEHHSGTTEVNNELKVQKIVNEVLDTAPDSTIISNVKNDIENGIIGTTEQKNQLLVFTGGAKVWKEVLSNDISNGTVDHRIPAEFLNSPIYAIKIDTLNAGSFQLNPITEGITFQEIINGSWKNSGFETDYYKLITAKDPVNSWQRTLFFGNDNDAQGCSASGTVDRQINNPLTPYGLISLGYTNFSSFVDLGYCDYNAFLSSANNGVVTKLTILTN